jgi:hypothetical protein
MPDAKRRPFARRPTRKYAHSLVLASVLASGLLRAGPPPAMVKGKVLGWDKLVPQVYADAAKADARRYTWREPSPTVKQDFRRLSSNVTRDVCVAAFSAAGPPQAHEPLAVKVTGGRMTPATVALPPGSRLSFRNMDPFPHVFYEAGNDKWAPNSTGPGSTREWAASAPGLHEIHDQLFPSVVMYVVVDPGVVEFAFPDHEGIFGMTLPQGEYTFRAFFDGKQVGKESPAVRVGDHGLVELREPLLVGGDSK